jgi:hypothetical protein
MGFYEEWIVPPLIDLSITSSSSTTWATFEWP